MHNLCVTWKNCMEFFHPTAHTVLHPTLLQEANLNINVWEYEVEYEKFDKWVLCVIFPIRSQASHFLKFWMDWEKFMVFNSTSSTPFDTTFCTPSCTKTVVGGYHIGNQWWENERHGFFLCSWPPTTELLTTWIGLSYWAFIGSLSF